MTIIGDFLILNIERGFTDGWQAEIHKVSDLTIRGASNGIIEVVAEPRYSDVLCFIGCSDIEIENMTFGHTIEQGNCQGAVLAFDDCQNIELRSLDLYGCGTYGVSAKNMDGLTLKNCIIRDCSYGIIDLASSSNTVLEDCTLKDNDGFDMLSLSESSVHFENCTFTGNQGDSFLSSYNYPRDESNVSFASSARHDMP